MSLEKNEKYVTVEYNNSFKKCFPWLKSFLRKHNLVLSGSTIPRILRFGFSDGDIDIYSCGKFKMSDIESVDSDYDREIVEKFGGVLVLTNIYGEMKKYNYKYVCPRFTINIIKVDCETKEEIYDYIDKSTDIDICSSTFDGHVCRIVPSLLQNKAISINEDLINEIDNLYTEFDEEKRNEVIKKSKETFLKKRITRIVKYESYGFDVKTNYEITNDNRKKSMKFLSFCKFKENKLFQELFEIVKAAYQIGYDKTYYIKSENYNLTLRILLGYKYWDYNQPESENSILITPELFPWISIWNVSLIGK